MENTHNKPGSEIRGVEGILSQAHSAVIHASLFYEKVEAELMTDKSSEVSVIPRSFLRSFCIGNSTGE